MMEEDAQHAVFQDEDHIQDRTLMSMSLKLDDFLTAICYVIPPKCASEQW